MAFLSTDPGIDPNQLAIQPNDWFGSNAPTATNTVPATADQVTALYQELLGRAPENQDVVNSWVTGIGAGGIDAVRQAIAASPEAQTYTNTSGSTTKPSAQAFIQQWQQSHSASEGIGPLTDALKAAGYSNVSSYMYGSTPSGNELSIDGQKFKVLGAENSPGAYWYTGGNDSSGGGGNGYGSLSGVA